MRTYRHFGCIYDTVHEYFKSIEIGWTTSAWEAYYIDNLHLTLWHVDERSDQNLEDGWGAVLSFTHTLGEKWLMFIRGGYVEDAGSLLEKSVFFTPEQLSERFSGKRSNCS